VELGHDVAHDFFDRFLDAIFGSVADLENLGFDNI